MSGRNDYEIRYKAIRPHQGGIGFNKLERQYVVATLSTHHRRVFIRHEGKLVKSFPFPIPGPIIKPLL